MRLALIANAHSGGGSDPDRLAGRLRAHGGEVSVFGADDGDAAGRAGAERIVVAGGDGTIGPAADVAMRAGVSLAVLPIGTANDFARSAGLPLDLAAAAALAAGTGGRLRPIDVADAGGTPFVNTAAAGLSVIAARRAGPLKRVLGPLAYGAGAVRAGLTARATRCRVTCDGEAVFAGDAWQVIVAGTGAFGGGAEVRAEDDDGRLDVTVVKAGPRLALVRHAVRMRAGTLHRVPGVRTARGREIRVEGVVTFNVDGEIREVPGGRFGLRGRVDVVVP